MSDKNLNTENKNAKPSWLSRINAKYFLELMFNHLANAKPIKILKCNQGLKKICSDEMQKDCANKLKDPSTWDLFLPYIYSVLSEIANEIYKKKYPNDKDKEVLKRYIKDEYIKQSKENISKLPKDAQKFFEPFINNEFLISQSKIIKIDVVEGITFLLIAEAVYLASKKLLFNKIQFNIQDKFNFNGQIISAIHNHVRKIFKSLLEDSTEGSLQDTINKYLDATEKDSWKIGLYCSYAISQETRDIVEQYISNNLRYNTDEQLIKKFSSVVLKIMCLSNYNLKNGLWVNGTEVYNGASDVWKDVSSFPAVAQSLPYYIY